MTADRTITVLHGAVAIDAPRDELDTLTQANAVAVALRSLGYCTELLPVNRDLDTLAGVLNARRPALVFNLVESLAGNGSFIDWIPRLLEAEGLTFTGAGADAMLLSSCKRLAKHWLTAGGLPTPDWCLDGHSCDDSRWIVKSCWEHASIGIDDDAIVCGTAAVQQRLARQRARYGGDWFAERYIEGREFNLALLETTDGVQVLPVAEVDFSAFPAGKPRIVNYAAKWDDGAFEYHHTPRRFPGADSDGALLANISELGRACWRLFGLHGYARVDFRVDRNGTPWILEINANPCLSPDAGFAAAAAAAGYEYTALTGHIVTVALQSRAGTAIPA